MKDIIVREINTRSDVYGSLLHFRNAILRIPLGLDLFTEDLSEDAQNHILVATEGDEIVGCIMLQPIDKETLKLRQMATAKKLRGKGLGKILVANAEETAIENGFKKIVLHARITAKGFYEKLGYQPVGATFIEVTIPHIAMQKTL